MQFGTIEPSLGEVVSGVEEMNQIEVVSFTIDYYKSLQAIKRANTCENKVLDYEIKITRVKLQQFGVNLQDLEFDA